MSEISTNRALSIITRTEVVFAFALKGIPMKSAPGQDDTSIYL